MRLDAARTLRSFACGGRTYRYYSVAAAQALGPGNPGDGAGHRNALDVVRGVGEHERTGHTRRGVGMVIIARFKCPRGRGHAGATDHIDTYPGRER